LLAKLWLQEVKSYQRLEKLKVSSVAPHNSIDNTPNAIMQFRYLTPLFVALAGSAHALNLTGDVLNGVPVISGLDLADVPSQAVSRYYLRVGELNGGTPLHLPVFVARGTPESLETGKKLSLSAAIHGDELNGVRVMHRILEHLEGQVATLNGTGILYFHSK
jgi:hypothetical protein